MSGRELQKSYLSSIDCRRIPPSNSNHRNAESCARTSRVQGQSLCFYRTLPDRSPGDSVLIRIYRMGVLRYFFDRASKARRSRPTYEERMCGGYSRAQQLGRVDNIVKVSRNIFEEGDDRFHCHGGLTGRSSRAAPPRCIHRPKHSKYLVFRLRDSPFYFG